MKLSKLAERILFFIASKGESYNEISPHELNVAQDVFLSAWEELQGVNGEMKVYVNGNKREWGNVDNPYVKIVNCSLTKSGKEYINTSKG